MQPDVVTVSEEATPNPSPNIPAQPQPPYQTMQTKTRAEQVEHSPPSPSEAVSHDHFLQATAMLFIASLVVLVEGAHRLSRSSFHMHRRKRQETQVSDCNANIDCLLLLGPSESPGELLYPLFAAALTEYMLGFAGLVVALICLLRKTLDTRFLKFFTIIQVISSIFIFVIHVALLYFWLGISFLDDEYRDDRGALAFLGLQTAQIEIALFATQWAALRLIRSPTVGNARWSTYKGVVGQAVLWNLNWALLGLWYILHAVDPLIDINSSERGSWLKLSVAGGLLVIAGAFVGIVVAALRKGLELYSIFCVLVQAGAMAAIAIAQPAVRVNEVGVGLPLLAPLNVVHIVIVGMLPFYFVYRSCRVRDREERPD